MRVLKASLYEAGDVVAEETVAMLTFRGFDLNDDRESRMLHYAHSLVSDERWDEILAFVTRFHAKRGKLTVPERAEAVRRLAATGVGDNEIGVRIGVTDRTVLRIRKEFGIASGWKEPAA